MRSFISIISITPEFFAGEPGIQGGAVEPKREGGQGEGSEVTRSAVEWQPAEAMGKDVLQPYTEDERRRADDEHRCGNCGLVGEPAASMGCEGADAEADDELQQRCRQRELCRKWRLRCDQRGHPFAAAMAVTEVDVNGPDGAAALVLGSACRRVDESLPESRALDVERLV